MTAGLVTSFVAGASVPSVDLLVALATGAHGGVTLDTAWPVGVPPGTHVWMQAWVQDAAALHGLSATRGLQVTTP
jgi:hypothetical protein